MLFREARGKRSDIVSGDLIQSAPETRSMGVYIGVRPLLRTLVSARCFYFGNPADVAVPRLFIRVLKST